MDGKTRCGRAGLVEWEGVEDSGRFGVYTGGKVDRSGRLGVSGVVKWTEVVDWACVEWRSGRVWKARWEEKVGAE